MFEAAAKDLIYLPSRKAYGRAASATNSERMASVKADFDNALESMKRQAAHANKVEKKVHYIIPSTDRPPALLKAELLQFILIIWLSGPACKVGKKVRVSVLIPANLEGRTSGELKRARGIPGIHGKGRPSAQH